jgi:hypothetical protein
MAAAAMDCCPGGTAEPAMKSSTAAQTSSVWRAFPVTVVNTATIIPPLRGVSRPRRWRSGAVDYAATGLQQCAVGWAAQVSRCHASCDAHQTQVPPRSVDATGGLPQWAQRPASLIAHSVVPQSLRHSGQYLVAIGCSSTTYWDANDVPRLRPSSHARAVLSL